MKIAIVTYMVLQWTLFFYLGYRWIVKPLRVERRLGFDGLLSIALGAFYWCWDPLGNALAPTFTVNAWIPNMGSWANEIPGWLTPASPGAQVPQVWAYVAAAYPTLFVLMPIAGCAVMRRIRARRPQMGIIGLLMSVWCLLIVVETVVEMAWMRMGAYTYAATPDWLVFFPDHYYKYPLLESVLWGGALTALTWVRWSVNDKGETVAERGVSGIKATPGAKTGLRLMAIVGLCYSLIFVTYFVPSWILWGSRTGSIPLDIQKRSYFMDGMCGPATNRACPGHNVPIFREDSVTITPDGKVYAPPGVKVPDGPTTFDDAARRDR